MKGQLQRLSDTRWKYQRGKQTHYIRQTNSGSGVERGVYRVDDDGEDVLGDGIEDICVWIDDGMPSRGVYITKSLSAAAKAIQSSPQPSFGPLILPHGGRQPQPAAPNRKCGSCHWIGRTAAAYCPSCGSSFAPPGFVPPPPTPTYQCSGCGTNVIVGSGCIICGTVPPGTTCRCLSRNVNYDKYGNFECSDCGTVWN